MTDEWLERLQQAIRVVDGDSAFERSSSKWAGHARQTAAVVVMHGPYDAGKSTLIKRLLVESGTPVPAWLTISGRRETTQVRAVTAGRLSYVDTPGIAGGNIGHDDKAALAVTRADVVLLVIPPQILATDVAWVKSLIEGDFYGVTNGRLFPPSSLLIVIAQADNAGIDPDDNPEGFHLLRQSKQDELLHALRLSPETERPRIHMVSADPYGQVGPQPQPSIGDYVRAEEWDGISGLRADLESLPARLAELRAAGQVRYWCWVAQPSLRTADRSLEELRPILDEAKSRSDRRAVLTARLQALDDSAVTALRTSIADELDGLTSGASELTGDALREMARARMAGCVERWYASFERKLSTLATDAEKELELEFVRPSSIRFNSWLNDMGAAGQNHLSFLAETLNDVRRLKSRMDRAMRKLVEFVTDSDMEGPTRSDDLIDALSDFADVGLEIFRSHQERILEQQRRKELREQTNKIGDELAEQILGSGEPPGSGWRGAVAELKAHLTTDSSLQPLVVQAAARVQELESAHSTLVELLSAPTVPATG